MNDTTNNKSDKVYDFFLFFKKIKKQKYKKRLIQQIYSLTDQLILKSKNMNLFLNLGIEINCSERKSFKNCSTFTVNYNYAL